MTATGTDASRLLVAENLVKTFQMRRSFTEVVTGKRARRLVALDDVSIELGRGEVLGVVGESGSGKSTLAYALIRQQPVDSGQIQIGGIDVRTAGGEQLRRLRREIQLIYQDPYSSLNPRMTVGRAILEPARVHDLVERGREQQLLGDLLERVGLRSETRARYPRELSGGQRQRVAIARALVLSPNVLVADEAVSALDVSVQAQILNLFGALQDELKLGIIFIAHQLAVVSHLATHVVVMYLGRIVEQGPLASVFNDSRHPYTQALLEAQPSVKRRRSDRAPAVRGEMPSPLALPSGCRFRTRCKLAQDICAQVDPPPVQVDPGHVSRCHVLAPDPLSSGLTG